MRSVGAVSDDSIKDLRRKIVKAGGNAAVLSFEIEDMSTIHAEFTGVQPPRTLRHESRRRRRGRHRDRRRDNRHRDHRRPLPHLHGSLRAIGVSPASRASRDRVADLDYVTP